MFDTFDWVRPTSHRLFKLRWKKQQDQNRPLVPDARFQQGRGNQEHVKDGCLPKRYGLSIDWGQAIIIIKYFPRKTKTGSIWLFLFSTLTSCSLVFQFLLFYTTFQPKMSNRSEISKKTFPLTVNQFKSIFWLLFPPVPNQPYNLILNLSEWLMGCRMRRSSQKIPI